MLVYELLDGEPSKNHTAPRNRFPIEDDDEDEYEYDFGAVPPSS